MSEDSKTIIIAAAEPDGKMELKINTLAVELMKQGHTVLRANSATEALVMCVQENPDMLIASDSLTKADPTQTHLSGESLMEFAANARKGDMLTTAFAPAAVEALKPLDDGSGLPEKLRENLAKAALILWDEDCLPAEGYREYALQGNLRMLGVRTLGRDVSLEEGGSFINNGLKTIAFLDYSGCGAQDSKMQALYDAGYNVIPFRFPIAAIQVLDFCTSHKVDMVITGDTPHHLNMGMTGVDILQDIATDEDITHKPERVWLTKSDEQGLARRMKQQGITAVYDDPPISSDMLLAVVGDRLREQGKGREVA